MPNITLYRTPEWDLVLRGKDRSRRPLGTAKVKAFLSGSVLIIISKIQTGKFPLRFLVATHQYESANANREPVLHALMQQIYRKENPDDYTVW